MHEEDAAHAAAAVTFFELIRPFTKKKGMLVFFLVFRVFILFFYAFLHCASMSKLLGRKL